MRSKFVAVIMMLVVMIFETNQITVCAGDFKSLLTAVEPYAYELEIPERLSEDEIKEEECDNIDVCRGEVINNHPFDMPYVFKTRADMSVVMRDLPWTKSYNKVKSNKVATIEPDSTIYVDGICRNQHNNIWLHATYNAQSGYVFVDNVLYDFDANLMTFAQVLIAYRDYYLDGDTVAAFAMTSYPHECADIRHWMDPGAKNIPYHVYFHDSCGVYTAESLGNMAYGALGTAFGLDEKLLLRGSGVANLFLSPKKKEDYLYECIHSYCDDPKDIADVRAGIEYWKNYK